MQDALIISKLEHQHAGGCDRQHSFAGDREFCDIHHISVAAWSGGSISVRHDGHHKNELFIAFWAVGSRRLRHSSVGISVSLYRQFAPRADLHCTRAAPGSASDCFCSSRFCALQIAYLRHADRSVGNQLQPKGPTYLDPDTRFL